MLYTHTWVVRICARACEPQANFLVQALLAGVTDAGTAEAMARTTAANISELLHGTGSGGGSGGGGGDGGDGEGHTGERDVHWR
jgi:hypothetical protein